MTDQGFKLFLAILKQHEGLRLKAYADEYGNWTIGYGHNLSSHGLSNVQAASTVWTQAQADTHLILDAQAAIDAVYAHWPWAVKLTDARQAVLGDMAFQLGIGGLSKFSNTLAAVQSGLYQIAANDMLESNWHSQTPDRCDRLAAMMRNGEWPVGLAV